MNRLLMAVFVLALGITVGTYALRGKTNISSLFTKGSFARPTPTVTPIITMTGFEETPSSGATTKGGETISTGTVSGKTTIAYSETGFSPNTITVKTGTPIVFMNQSTSGMWVASDMHPTHQLLPGFDELKSVSNGGTYEYTFTRVGTWTYHNHMKPSIGGTVIVTP